MDAEGFGMRFEQRKEATAHSKFIHCDQIEPQMAVLQKTFAFQSISTLSSTELHLMGLARRLAYRWIFVVVFSSISSSNQPTSMDLNPRWNQNEQRLGPDVCAPPVVVQCGATLGRQVANSRDWNMKADSSSSSRPITSHWVEGSALRPDLGGFLVPITDYQIKMTPGIETRRTHQINGPYDQAILFPCKVMPTSLIFKIKMRFHLPTSARSSNYLFRG